MPVYWRWMVNTITGKRMGILLRIGGLFIQYAWWPSKKDTQPRQRFNG